MPCVASPPANVTAWPSAMPTSKNRSGHRFWKMPVPVPDGIAAVIATRSAVLRRELRERLAEHLGPGRRAARLLARLAGDGIVRREAVPLLPVRLGEAEALALLGEHVDHARPFMARTKARVSHSFSRSWPSIGPEVAEAELLEQHARRPEVLDALLDVLGEVHHAVAEDAAEGERSSASPARAAGWCADRRRWRRASC